LGKHCHFRSFISLRCGAKGKEKKKKKRKRSSASEQFFCSNSTWSEFSLPFFVFEIDDALLLALMLDFQNLELFLEKKTRV
jgi:hypothetical protein